jgi:hypothetical protein
MKDGAVVGSIGVGTPHGEIEVGTAAPVTEKQKRCCSTTSIVEVAQLAVLRCAEGCY